MKTVIIDPGHGGKFPGAVNGDRREKDFNLPTAWAVYDYLKGKEVSCLLTRHLDRELADNVSTDLRRRTEIANRASADLFVSIHADSIAGENRKTAKGYSAYCLEGSEKGLIACTTILESMARNLPDRNNRGEKFSTFNVLRKTAMPAVLVECGFISHREESEWLFRNIVGIAEAIGDGIIATLYEGN